MNSPRIIVGEVRHARTRPRVNAFRYPIFNLRIPLPFDPSAQIPLKLNRFGVVSFFDKDHGARDGSDLTAWARGKLQSQGIETSCTFELVCLPRIFGFVFNPVSFWLCWSAPGVLRAIIAEVANTFGERLSYVLTPADGVHIKNGEVLTCEKKLHVSPFNEVRGSYQFRAFVSDARFLMRIDYDDAQFAGETLLSTHISGIAQPLTVTNMRRLLWAMPWLTVQVVVKIHWQAVKLIAKRVRFLGYLPSEGKR